MVDEFGEMFIKSKIDGEKWGENESRLHVTALKMTFDFPGSV